MAEDIIYETVDTIQANEPCEGSRWNPVRPV